MDIRKMSQVIRKFLPNYLFKIIRSLGGAILTPLLFSIRTGHFKSSLINKAVDKNNKLIP